VELVAVETSSFGTFLFVRKDLKNCFPQTGQTVRTQFSKDDVESSDLLGYWIVDDDDGV
jgi:hypothetical protein